jgi:hypothetical protein
VCCSYLHKYWRCALHNCTAPTLPGVVVVAQCALHAATRQLTTACIATTFNKRLNTLQVSELSAGAAALSASAEDPAAADKTTNKDSDGQSSAEAAAAHERRRVIRTLRKAFRRADSDGNGVLDVPEVSSSSTCTCIR